MRSLARAVSWLSLAGTILPPLLFFADRMSLDQVKLWMAVATVKFRFADSDCFVSMSSVMPTGALTADSCSQISSGAPLGFVGSSMGK